MIDKSSECNGRDTTTEAAAGIEHPEELAPGETPPPSRETQIRLLQEAAGDIAATTFAYPGETPAAPPSVVVPIDVAGRLVEPDPPRAALSVAMAARHLHDVITFSPKTADGPTERSFYPLYIAALHALLSDPGSASFAAWSNIELGMDYPTADAMAELRSRLMKRHKLLLADVESMPLLAAVEMVAEPVAAPQAPAPVVQAEPPPRRREPALNRRPPRGELDARCAEAVSQNPALTNRELAGRFACSARSLENKTTYKELHAERKKEAEHKELALYNRMVTDRTRPS